MWERVLLMWVLWHLLVNSGWDHPCSGAFEIRLPHPSVWGHAQRNWELRFLPGGSWLWALELRSNLQRILFCPHPDHPSSWPVLEFLVVRDLYLPQSPSLLVEAGIPWRRPRVWECLQHCSQVRLCLLRVLGGHPQELAPFRLPSFWQTQLLLVLVDYWQKGVAQSPRCLLGWGALGERLLGLGFRAYQMLLLLLREN